MPQTSDVAGASARAGLVAGPMFVTALTLFSLQERASDVIEFNLATAAPALLMLLFSMLFGLVLAFPLCLLVGSIMGRLATTWPLLRSTALWLIVAVGIALAIVGAIFELRLESGSIAFVLTAITCAATVRTRLHWD